MLVTQTGDATDLLSSVLANQTQETSEIYAVPHYTAPLRDSRFIETSEILGQGAFGRVVKGIRRDTGENVAIKAIRKPDPLSLTYLSRKRALQTEIAISTKVSHHSVVEYIGVYQDESFIYFVMEYCSKKDLESYVLNHGLEEIEAIAPRIVAGLVSALNYLQNIQVIHGDIKPSNILLTSNFHVKLTDFGSAQNRCGEVDVNFAGTAEYLSPEVIMKSTPTVASDLWAVGCVLYFLYVGTSPFSRGTAYKSMCSVKNAEFTFPPYFPYNARDLVQRCLQKCPSDRFGMDRRNKLEAFKKHPYFDSGLWWDTDSFPSTTASVDCTAHIQRYLKCEEHAIYFSIVQKRGNYGSYVRRLLLLSDRPRLSYIDLQSGVSKELLWNADLCATVLNRDEFLVNTSSREYHFVDGRHKAPFWCGKINSFLKKMHFR